jgi:hypothetical protein
MSTEINKVSQQENTELINRLTGLLEQQINVIQCSDIAGRLIEILAEQTQTLVNEISEKGLLDSHEYKEQREHIKRLYHHLNIAIIARKCETEKQLNHIRKGKKTIGTYHRSISTES